MSTKYCAYVLLVLNWLNSKHWSKTDANKRLIGQKSCSKDKHCHDPLLNILFFFFGDLFAFVRCQGQGINDLSPYKWKNCNQEWNGVSIGKHGTFSIAVQDLIWLVCISMMIRMPLKFEKKQVCDDLWSVPWMSDLHRLINWVTARDKFAL